MSEKNNPVSFINLCSSFILNHWENKRLSLFSVDSLFKTEDINII